LFQDDEAAEFLKGSAAIALESEPMFDRYWFVDRKPDHIQALEELKARFPARTIDIVREDANSFLHAWCQMKNVSDSIPAPLLKQVLREMNDVDD
jgi:three-Cys-motif partner protein